MGLLGDRGRADFSNPVRVLSSSITAAPNNRSSLSGQMVLGNGEQRWRPIGMDKHAAQPAGYLAGGAWSLPLAAGAMAARVDEGAATASGFMHEGRALEGVADGTSTATATGALIANGQAVSAGSATATAMLVGVLAGAGTSVGTSTASGTMAALVNGAGVADGVATATGILTGIGNMSGTTESLDPLSPTSLAEAVWVAAPDVYTAKVLLFDDDAAVVDRYVVSWFKNGAVIASATSPTIQVVRVADGTDLVALAAMTPIAALGRFRFDAAGARRIAAGAAYLIVVGAVIDGAARTWDQPMGRDSA